MELRPPPTSGTPRRTYTWLKPLLLAQLMGLGVLAALLWWRGAGSVDRRDDPERLREVAAKLLAAGALDEAAGGFERYLAVAEEPPEVRARVAFSVGTTYLEQGAYEKALRWFYEAESFGAEALEVELGQKVVHALESLGQHHAARAALGSRVQLGGDDAERAASDPVVARIGEEEIRRSEVERMLDDLPPEMAAALTGAEQRAALLRRFVAEELLWRKAVKLEYDKDPEVRRRQAALTKQLTVSRLVEREVFDKIQMDESDLRNFFAANQERYRQPAKDGEPAVEPTFEQARRQIERDYRLEKTQAAYEAMVESELATDAVELFPERMSGG